jgi:hypothetical protein
MWKPKSSFAVTCFHPGRAKDLSAPLYIPMLLICQEYYITVLCYDLRIHWFCLGKGIQQWKDLMIVLITRVMKRDCSNYWGVSVLATTYKTPSNICFLMLTQYVGEINGDSQCLFSHNIWITKLLYVQRLSNILEKNRNAMGSISAIYRLQKHPCFS